MEVPHLLQPAEHARDFSGILPSRTSTTTAARAIVAGAKRQLREHRRQRDGQVVDAEVAGSSSARMACDTRPGRAREDDEPRGDRRARRAPRGVPLSRSLVGVPFAILQIISEFEIGRLAPVRVRVEAIDEPPRVQRRCAAAGCARPPPPGWRGCARGYRRAQHRRARRAFRGALPRAETSYAGGVPSLQLDDSSTRFDRRVEGAPNRSCTLIRPSPRISM